VGLIVTAGGLTAARAAFQYATKPFISLFGGTTVDFPGTIRNNFYGGVFLDTVNHNDNRVRHLNGLGHQSANICLLINPDSKLASTEKQKWQTANPVRGKIFEARDLQGIADAFAEFLKTGPGFTLTAMVVSSDPYFQDNKGFLIDQTSISNLRKRCGSSPSTGPPHLVRPKTCHRILYIRSKGSGGDYEWNAIDAYHRG
jgi:hypothetical protein